MSLKSAFKSLGSKIKSGAKIVGTNIKNSVSKDSISAFVKGFSVGGLPGAIANAAITTTTKSMVELDKSGNFNDAYAYKLGGFANNEDYQLALENGFEKASDFLAELKNNGISSIDQYRQMLNGQNAVAVSANEEVVVTPQNDGGASSVDTVGGVTVVSSPANVVSSVKKISSTLSSSYDTVTNILRNSI